MPDKTKAKPLKINNGQENCAAAIPIFATHSVHLVN